MGLMLIRALFSRICSRALWKLTRASPYQRLPGPGALCSCRWVATAWPNRSPVHFSVPAGSRVQENSIRRSFHTTRTSHCATSISAHRWRVVAALAQVRAKMRVWLVAVRKIRSVGASWSPAAPL